MPSSTAKQKRTMAAAAHNPAFAKKMGIPVSVAKDFNRADTRGYQEGGTVTERDELADYRKHLADTGWKP